MGFVIYVFMYIHSAYNQLAVEQKQAKLEALPSLELLATDHVHEVKPLLPVTEKKTNTNKKKQNKAKKNSKPKLSDAQGRVGEFLVTLFSTSNKNGKWQAMISYKQSQKHITEVVEVQYQLGEYKVIKIEENKMLMSNGKNVVPFLLFKNVG